MKKRLLIIAILILSFALNIKAQDLIYKKDESIVKAKVEDFGISKITYKIWEYQKAPSQSLNVN